MKMDRAKELVQQFSKKRLLVVGDIVIDHYIYGVVERLNPEAPVPILLAKREHVMTGGAGNTAKNLAKLGAKAVLVSVAGEDEWSTQLEETARQEHYELQLVKDSSRPTIRKVRHLVGNQQMLRVDYEETKDLTPEDEKKLLALVDRHIDQVDGVIISDYAKGVITERVATTVLKEAQKRKLFVAADVKPSRAPYVIGASLISPNLREGHEFLGLNPHERGGRLAADLAEKLHKKMKAEVYLTLGADGIFVSAGEGQESLVSQEHVVEVFDVSGAGDTAVAMLTLARLAQATPQEAAQLANAAGAVVVGKIGSVGLTQEELLNMIGHKHAD
jgi:rfaE bifunctional protein kinase chain/domain